MLQKQKIIAPRTVSLLVVPTVLFIYFRFATDSPYVFTSFWNGPVTYLDKYEDRLKKARDTIASASARKQAVMDKYLK